MWKQVQSKTKSFQNNCENILHGSLQRKAYQTRSENGH